MKRRLRLLAAVAVVLVLVAGAVLIPRYRYRSEVRSAITRYDLALGDALRDLDPERLGDTAYPREKTRVTNYITSLWGRGVKVDAELLELEVVEIRSAEPTITVRALERWRFVERDKDTDKQIGEPVDESNDLTYILVKDANGRIAVYLSQLTEDLEETAEQ
ncbi:MAG: hypothetical protein C0418_05900 [Coriobacteriaceae bacterium]|nr:hypothetical protein [Coriobacteriaceae bacterium]